MIRTVLIVGFGSVGQGLLPLLFKHFPDIRRDGVSIITADTQGCDIAFHYGITNYRVFPLTEDNHVKALERYESVDAVINVSVDVSSVALIKWAQQHGALYIDAWVEPWAGGYANADREKNTNNYLRDQVLALAEEGKPTALVAHGANPGLVSYLVKPGLEELAKLRGIEPTNYSSYGELAYQLGIKVVHVAERDTQTDGKPWHRNIMRNTWSCDGLLTEAAQDIELGWGTHEVEHDGIVESNAGSPSAYWGPGIMGAATKIKSWVPSVGEQEAFCISHSESLSIADLLTYREYHEVKHRPTVLYAYKPCDHATTTLSEMGRRGFHTVKAWGIMREEIVSGGDELGLLFVWDGGAYWYGSTLTIQQARKLAPHNSATSLQVTSNLVAALKWAEKNPLEGVLEAEDVDFDEVLSVSLPYLGEVAGYMTDWQPGSTLQFHDFLVKKEEQ